jgi:uncharacterized RDD family membrane protein YckC
MKCPKCHYISFDEVERCRNCGYDFTLSRTEPPSRELSLRQDAPPEGPARDFPLAGSPLPSATPDVRRAGRDEGRAPSSAVDLPLFDAPVPGVDDTPLLTQPAPPRSPLSVRRATPDTPRATPAPPLSSGRAGSPVSANPGAVSATSARPRELPAVPPADTHAVASEPMAGTGADAPAGTHVSGRRVVAALIDLVILGAIDLAVLSFTLRLTGLDTGRLTSLPLIPFIAFLMLLNGGYLVGFTTASGQTIGKMATGIRVVGAHSARVPLGHAIVRAAGVVVTMFSLGIGFLPCFFGRDRCALHDRLAGTRVVRR